MKQIKSILTIFILSLVCQQLLTGCKDNEIIVAKYIKLSAMSYTLDDTGTESFTLTVTSAPDEWTIAAKPEWVSIEENSTKPSEITLTASPNTGEEQREGQIRFVSGDISETFTLYQLGTKKSTFRYRLTNEYSVFNVSPNGTYAIGIKMALAGGESYTYTPVVINMATEETEELATITSTTAGIQGINDITSPLVSDKGTQGDIFVLANATYGLHYSNGEWTKMTTTIEGIPDINVTIQGVSSDGSVWVGYASPSWKVNRHNYRPIKYVNGVMQELAIPEYTSYGEENWNGAMVRGCSADGKVLYGSEWTGFSLCYWDEAGEYHFVAPESVYKHEVEYATFWGTINTDSVYDSPIMTANLHNISGDGSHIGYSYRRYLSVNQQKVTVYSPAFYNIKTQENILMTDVEDGGGTGATDEYGFWGTPGAGILNGYVYSFATKTSVPANVWIQQQYGLTFADNDFYIMKSFGNGRVLLGNKVISSPRGVSYIMWYIYDSRKS
jgi:hypothetical protein